MWSSIFFNRGCLVAKALNNCLECLSLTLSQCSQDQIWAPFTLRASAICISCLIFGALARNFSLNGYTSVFHQSHLFGLCVSCVPASSSVLFAISQKKGTLFWQQHHSTIYSSSNQFWPWVLNFKSISIILSLYAVLIGAGKFAPTELQRQLVGDQTRHLERLILMSLVTSES